MEITMHEIPVREVVKDFIDDPNLGCRGYDGRLNIRPAFQREFVYKNEQRNKVIQTVKKNFLLMMLIDDEVTNCQMLCKACNRRKSNK